MPAFHLHATLAGMLLITAAALITGCASTPSATDPAARRMASLQQIEHIVVIYAENRSFDHLYGMFPGAEGIKSVDTSLADGRKPPSEPRTVIYNGQDGAINFQPHHQPFNYYVRFAPGTKDREEHLRDYDDLIAAIDTGTLPQVTFYKPVGRLNQHPGSSDVAAGDAHISALLERLHTSPQWTKMAIIVTYDENGGFWDHVPPPSGPGWGDRWGPGTRIPTLIVSPFAKRGFVDKTSYDTTSILKLVVFQMWR